MLLTLVIKKAPQTTFSIKISCWFSTKHYDYEDTHQIYSSRPQTWILHVSEIMNYIKMAQVLFCVLKLGYTKFENAGISITGTFKS